jgi:uncharacterized membrane protein
MTDLGTLGGNSSDAIDSGAGAVALLNGTTFHLPALASHSASWAHDANDGDRIVGESAEAGYGRPPQRAVLWTPKSAPR